MASYDLTADQAGEDGLVCGGRMQVFIEPVEGTPTLCLFGAGHVAQPLARMAKGAGFRVEVVDDRLKMLALQRRLRLVHVRLEARVRQLGPEVLQGMTPRLGLPRQSHEIT